MTDRVAGHRGLGLDYGQLQNAALVTEALITAGLELRDEAGADGLLFAGAGLVRYVEPLEKATGLPVIDPTQAATALVIGQIMQAAYART